MWPWSLFLLSLGTVVNIEFLELFSNLTVHLPHKDEANLSYILSPFVMSSFAHVPLLCY